MKINLLYNSNDILNDYLNIDHAEDGPYKTKGDVANLNSICEPAQCRSLIAADIIDKFPAYQVGQIIQHWISKIHHEGIIVIGGVDISTVFTMLHYNYIDYSKVNKILFGETGERKSTLSSLALIETLKRADFKILKHNIDVNNYRYIVEAQRK